LNAILILLASLQACVAGQQKNDAANQHMNTFLSKIQISQQKQNTKNDTHLQ
jgi:hypothetical protein